jgi:hypothetical protein
MAALCEHNLGELVSSFSLSTFIETGLGDGEGFSYSRQFPFIRRLSCDVMEVSVEKAVCNPEFSPDTDSVSLMDAVDFVNAVQGARGLFPCDFGNALWWIDAHFPGVDTGINRWDQVNDGSIISTPDELEAIRNGPCANDVIIIDDAFLFRSGLIHDQFSDRVPARYMCNMGSLEQTLEKFRRTHNIKVITGITGSIVITPKQ